MHPVSRHLFHWHIVGVGSVGGLFAARMAAAGIPVTLLLRDARAVDAYTTHAGIHVDFADAPSLHVRPPALPADTLEWPPAHLLVATKATDTLAAMAPLIRANGAGQLVLLLQNGMGSTEAIRARWPQLQVWNAVTTAGVWRESAFHLHCVARGETWAGCLADASDDNNGEKFRSSSVFAPAMATLAATGLLTLSADISRLLWQKLAVNAVINALTAIYQCRNGELLEIAQARAQLLPLADEVARVAAAEGITFADSVLASAEHVIRQTAGNFSSMNRDVAAGRPTEIEFINGYIVARARQHGIDTPINTALLAQVRALSAR